MKVTPGKEGEHRRESSVSGTVSGKHTDNEATVFLSCVPASQNPASSEQRENGRKY